MTKNSVEPRRVKVKTKLAGGCCSATAGVVYDAKSGRELAQTKPFPPGFDGAAYDAAVGIANARKWTVVA